MALQMTKTTRYGIIAENAYHRIENVTISNKNSLQFEIKSYKDSQSKLAFDNLIFVTDYDIEGDNPIAQAYAHLKTLPEFAGATDC